MMTYCPICNRSGTLAVAEDALIMSPGPEGPTHVIGCKNCGWNRPTVKLTGTEATAPLVEILKEKP